MKNDLLYALSVIDRFGLTVVAKTRKYTNSIKADGIRATIRGNTFTNDHSRRPTDPKVKARILKMAGAHPDWTYPAIADKVGNVHHATVGRIVRAG